MGEQRKGRITYGLSLVVQNVAVDQVRLLDLVTSGWAVVSCCCLNLPEVKSQQCGMVHFVLQSQEFIPMDPNCHSS